MIGSKIVDAHHHLWDPSVREYPWMAGDALVPIRRRYAVDDLRAVIAGTQVRATVLVQTVSSTAETVEFLEVASDSGGLVAGVVGWADLTAPELPDDRLLVGVRHQVEDEPDPDWLLRADVLRGLRALGERGLVYDLLVRAPQRPAALRVTGELDDVAFVLDHAGKPGIAAGEWEPWASWLAGMAARENVVCKLSGLITEADWATWGVATLRPYVEHVLEVFGPDRVLFGSDWPVCELAGSYADVLDATARVLTGLSADEQANVLGRNAIRVYGLSV